MLLQNIKQHLAAIITGNILMSQQTPCSFCLVSTLLI